MTQKIVSVEITQSPEPKPFDCGPMDLIAAVAYGQRNHDHYVGLVFSLWQAEYLFRETTTIREMICIHVPDCRLVTSIVQAKEFFDSVTARPDRGNGNNQTEYTGR